MQIPPDRKRRPVPRGPPAGLGVLHTPLTRTPKLPPERVLVISAEGDRIAPPEHATRLAQHFGADELRFPGGHLMQLGRGDAFRTMIRRMAAHGLVPPR